MPWWAWLLAGGVIGAFLVFAYFAWVFLDDWF